MKKLINILLSAAIILSCIGTVGISFAFAADSEGFYIESLEQYCVYTGEIANDGYIGIPVGIKTYVADVSATDSTTPHVIYVVNVPDIERIGTDSDETILTDLINRGYVVTVLDYYNNAKMVTPDLEWSIQEVKVDLRTNATYRSTYLAGVPCSTTYVYNLPAGYNLAHQVNYWSIDRHGAEGSLDFIMNVWNMDFLATKGGKTITFKEDTKILKGAGESEYLEFAAGESMTVEEYTAMLSGGMVTDITQCIKPDGTPIDLNLYMDIVYPANPENEVPLFVNASSHENTVGAWKNPARPYLSGFLYRGYAIAIYDYGYVPMARDDHYSYFGGDDANAISGDNKSFAIALENTRSATAAIRYLRYLSETENDTYKFDKEHFGVMGASKTGNSLRLGHPDPESLFEIRYFEDQNGATRYELGDTEDRVDENGNVLIEGGEPQPWLTYSDGSKIPSNVQFIHTGVGSGDEAIVDGHAPIYSSGTMLSGGDYSGFWPSVRSKCYSHDVVHVGYTAPDVGHGFGQGIDPVYGHDLIVAFWEMADYYLRDEAARCEYIEPLNGSVNVSATEKISVKFNAPVSAEEIKKVSIISNNSGEAANGEWSASYGSSLWEFTPYNLRGGHTYTATVPKLVKAENGKEIKALKTATFTVEPEMLKAALNVTGESMTLSDTTNEVYVSFDETDFSNSTTTKVRFGVENDAANAVEVYSAVDGSASEILGTVYVSGAGEYDLDITDYVNSLDGENTEFILKVKKNAGVTVISEASFDELDKGYFAVSLPYEFSSERDNTTGAGQSIKITDNKLITKYLPSHAYYEGWTTLGTFNVLSAFTDEDYGRRFNISFDVYDTTERYMGIYVGNHSSNGEIDFKAIKKTYKTDSDAWKTLSADFSLNDERYVNGYFDKHKITLYTEQHGTDTSEKPIYIDNMVLTETVSNIKIADGSVYCAPSLVLHPANKVSATEIDSSYIVSGTAADVSYEAEANLLVSGRNGGMFANNRKTYVKIDLSDFDKGKPAMLLIKSLSTNSGTIKVYGVKNKAASEKWSSADISYINAPANDRFSGGVNIDAVYGNSALDSVSVNGVGYYMADITDYAAEMKDLGASEATVILISDTEGKSLNFEIADASTDTNIYYKVMDFDNKTSWVSGTKKAEVNDVADMRLTSNETGKVTIADGVDRTSDNGKSLKFSMVNTYTRAKFYNFYDHVLTEDDVGRQFKVSFWVMADSEASFDIGLMSAEGKSGTTDANGDSYHFNSTFYTESNPSKKITLAANEWTKADYTITVTEKMLSTYLGEDYAAQYYNPALFTIVSSGLANKTMYVDDFVIEELAEEAKGDNGDSGEESVSAYSNTLSFDDWANANDVTMYGATGDTSSDKSTTGLADVDRIGESGKSLRLVSKATGGLSIWKFKSLFESSFTEADLGKKFKVSVWVKPDNDTEAYLGLTALNNGASAGFTRWNNVLYSDSENAITTASLTAGEWQKISVMITVTEPMLGSYYTGYEASGYNPEVIGLRLPLSSAMYVDDVTVQEYVDGYYTAAEATEAVTISSASVSKDDLGVTKSAGGTEEGIKKAYLHFECGEYENTQKATLNINVEEAIGQTLKVYGLIDSTYPAELTYNTAPGTNSDESMDTSKIYGREALDEIVVTGSGIYSFDVTNYVKENSPNEYIFVITSEDVGGYEYYRADFSSMPATDGVDYISDGSVTVSEGVMSVAGNKITFLNVFGNDGKAVTAGEFYQISADVTASSAGDVTIGFAKADGTIAERAAYTLAEGESANISLNYTATEADTEICAVTIESANAGFSVDNVVVDKGDAAVVISKNAELVAEVAKDIETDTPETVKITVSSNSGNVIIDEADEGYTVTKEVNPGTALALSATGDGQFLYWVDANSKTILSYNVDYSFTVGSDRSIAAVYADSEYTFVTFTSMANKLVASGISGSVTVPENPYVYGYTFDGWYANGEKQELTAGETVTAKVNTEYKAGFVKDNTTYEVTVDGSVTEYTYNEKVTVTADAEKDGSAFSYWKRDGEIVSYSTSYSFYVNGDTTLEAIYGESAEGEIVLVMATPVLVGTDKIAFFAERDIPASYELIETGILIGTANDLTVETAPYKATAKSTLNKGQYTVRKANVKSGETWYAAAYAIYRDANGSVLTAYSNEIRYAVE